MLLTRSFLLKFFSALAVQHSEQHDRTDCQCCAEEDVSLDAATAARRKFLIESVDKEAVWIVIFSVTFGIYCAVDGISATVCTHITAVIFVFIAYTQKYIFIFICNRFSDLILRSRWDIAEYYTFAVC